MSKVILKGKFNQEIEFIDIYSKNHNSTVSNAKGKIKSYLITPDGIYVGIIKNKGNSSNDDYNDIEYISIDMLIKPSPNALMRQWNGSLPEICIKLPKDIKDKLYMNNNEYEIYTIYIDEKNIIYSVYDKYYAEDNNIFDKKQILKYVKDINIDNINGIIKEFI